jgi:hypothetical protein
MRSAARGTTEQTAGLYDASPASVWAGPSGSVHALKKRQQQPVEIGGLLDHEEMVGLRNLVVLGRRVKRFTATSLARGRVPAYTASTGTLMR